MNQGLKQAKGNAEALLSEDVKNEMNDKSDKSDEKKRRE